MKSFSIPIGKCESGYVYLDWLSKKVWLVPRAVLYRHLNIEHQKIFYIISMVVSAVFGLLVAWEIQPKWLIYAVWGVLFIGIVKLENRWKKERPFQKIKAKSFDVENAVNQLLFQQRSMWMSFFYLMVLVLFSTVILMGVIIPFLENTLNLRYETFWSIISIKNAIALFGLFLGSLYSFLIGSAKFFRPLAIDYIRAHKKELFDDRLIEYKHQYYVGTQVQLEDNQIVTILGVAASYDYQYPERTHDYVGLLCESSINQDIKLIYFNEWDVIKIVCPIQIEEWEKEFQERLLAAYPKRKNFMKMEKLVKLQSFKNSLFGEWIEGDSDIEIGQVRQTNTKEKVIVVKMVEQSVIVALLEDRYVEGQRFLELGYRK